MKDTINKQKLSWTLPLGLSAHLQVPFQEKAKKGAFFLQQCLSTQGKLEPFRIAGGFCCDPLSTRQTIGNLVNQTDGTHDGTNTTCANATRLEGRPFNPGPI